MNRNATWIFSLGLAGLLGGCGGNGDNAGDGSGAAVEFVDTVSGAGASFPVPVYDVWRYEWGQEHDVTVNYNSVGSGAGIRQITAKTVDFGASDAPLKKEELDEAGLVQWPMLVGAVVPVVNIEGVGSGELKLTGPVLADIFLGNISNWSDEAITSLNPELDLPDASINVVHRSDSSGTTWIFTSYLSKVSDAWANGPGWGKTPEWPTGIGAPQNPGVANQVSQNNNSIGYVQSDFAVEQNLPVALLQNQAGNYVEPTIPNIQSAAGNADWQNAPGMYVVLTNQPGADTWPIAGATYLLVHTEQESKAKIQTILSWADWALSEGGGLAEEKYFVPLPDNVVGIINDLWASEITANGEPVWPIGATSGEDAAAY
ncbi:MAG: phosphate ABC transporter substrate-binding protein PstS [Opitutales bacterium]